MPACGWVLVAVAANAREVRAASDKPNIVIILADDLGNADLGYRGSDIKTPNIDKLASEGVRLESFYGMPVCTPSRAQLMTGRYAMRYGSQTLVIFPSHAYGLPTDERTLPQALKDAGYQTAMARYPPRAGHRLIYSVVFPSKCSLSASASALVACTTPPRWFGGA